MFFGWSKSWILLQSCLVSFIQSWSVSFMFQQTKNHKIAKRCSYLLRTWLIFAFILLNLRIFFWVYILVASHLFSQPQGMPLEENCFFAIPRSHKRSFRESPHPRDVATRKQTWKDFVHDVLKAPKRTRGFGEVFKRVVHGKVKKCLFFFRRGCYKSCEWILVGGFNPFEKY